MGTLPYIKEHMYIGVARSNVLHISKQDSIAFPLDYTLCRLKICPLLSVYYAGDETSLKICPECKRQYFISYLKKGGKDEQKN